MLKSPVKWAWLEVSGTPIFSPVSSVSISTSLAKPLRESRRPNGRFPQFQRRRVGLIRDAIIAVLAEHEGGLRVRDIAVAVTKRLGEPIPPSSIKSCLSRGARREWGEFEQIGRGRYRLRSGE